MLTLVLRESQFFATKRPSPTDPRFDSLKILIPDLSVWIQTLSIFFSCQRRQRLITTLLACALDEPGQNMFPIEISDVIRLLCFIGEQILQPENAEIAFQSQKIISVR